MEDAAGDALAETTTEPDLATAIDALTSQLRELVEASVHQLLVLQTDEGDDLAQRFADEMVGRVNYADDGPAWDAFLAAIRAERG